MKRKSSVCMFLNERGMGVIFLLLLHETKHFVISQLSRSLHPLQDTNMKKTCPNNPCLPYYLQASLLSSPLYNLNIAKKFGYFKPL